MKNKLPPNYYHLAARLVLSVMIEKGLLPIIEASDTAKQALRQKPLSASERGYAIKIAERWKYNEND